MTKTIFKSVDDVVDKRGKGIDEGIKGVVYHLNVLGIQTTQSCEGHLERGAHYFWIDFEEKDYDRALALIYEFNKSNFNICIDRRAYYDPTEKIMYCRLMPIERGEKRYEKNKELIKTFETFLKNYKP